jgi:site-specific DNA-methyltransferase (adenine-specific)
MSVDIHFSSKTNEWGTPQDLFNWLNKDRKFIWDLAASHQNTKCKLYYSIDLDALSRDWSKDIGIGGHAFLNPPYGREIGKFLKKAFEESKKGIYITCLIPARTDTKYFHSYCSLGKVSFIKGRLKFKNGNINAPAPFPSAIVEFGTGIAPSTNYIEQVWKK